jgi:putative phosphoesterase
VKILIISDSHGNIVNLKHVLGFGQKIHAEAIIHCGDWNTLESIETVLSFGIPLYAVLGNADVREDVIQKLKTKSQKFSEEFLEFELGGRKIGVIHKIKHLVPGIEYPGIIFFGDTHIQEEKKKDEIRFINPGALINGINFAVYDITSGKIEFINE